MNFIGLTMVKNEEDIIEQFVRHNLKFFSKLYVFDHGSCDNTVAILQKLAGEGLPIVQVFDNASSFVGYAQAQIMTGILSLAIKECGNGIYFPIDADEFLYSNVGVDELTRQIDAYSNFVLNIPNVSMAFPADAGDDLFSDAPKSFGLMERWDVSTGKDVKVLIKVSDPSIADRLALMQGNHNVYENGVLIKKDLTFDALRYVHVPVRSPEQAFRKFVCGWFSNVQKFGTNSAVATHWKQAFNLICEEDDYANKGLAHLLNSVYTGPINMETDYEEVDAKKIFMYELAYGNMRKKGFSVILRNVEADFNTLFKKMNQQ